MKYPINPELEQKHSRELISLLNKYSNVFSDNPGNTNLVEHKIDLISDEPVRVKPYPVPYSVRNEIKKEVQEMLNLRVIEQTDSAYAAPVVLVSKKEGSTRFCIDYRRLNNITVFDPEPMNQPDDIFAKLASDKYYAKIYMAKGY